MTNEELRDTVLQLLGRIAPEADLTKLRPAVSLRDQLDIDSMDFLNFVVAIHDALHVDIPETDYAKMASLDGCVAYLAERCTR